MYIEWAIYKQNIRNLYTNKNTIINPQSHIHGCFLQGLYEFIRVDLAFTSRYGFIRVHTDLYDLIRVNTDLMLIEFKIGNWRQALAKFYVKNYSRAKACFTDI